MSAVPEGKQGGCGSYHGSFAKWGQQQRYRLGIPAQRTSEDGSVCFCVGPRIPVWKGKFAAVYPESPLACLMCPEN